MNQWIADVVFAVDGPLLPARAWPAAYSRRTAKELHLKEAWFRDAIAARPDLVMGPCEAAGLVDEGDEWRLWKTEFSVSDPDGMPVGAVDVLLVSSSGAVAVVETKLASNTEGRRTVLAQLLDYAVQIADSPISKLPSIPGKDGTPFTSEEAVESCLSDGKLLVIVAGDQLDPHAVKLGRALLGSHLTRRWTLALVELAIYEKTTEEAGPRTLIVPHIRGAVVPEVRQVVRVVVEGETPKAKVIVDAVPPDVDPAEGWTEDRFFAALHASGLDRAVKTLADKLRDLTKRADNLRLDYGRGRLGSMTLKRNGVALVGLYLDGKLWFVPAYFERALGTLGQAYLSELRTLFPGRLPSQPGQEWIAIPAPEAAQAAPQVVDLVTRYVETEPSANP